MNNGAYPQNGSGKNEENDLNVRQTDEILRDFQQARAQKRTRKKYDVACGSDSRRMKLLATA
jgi:hypothetical protein